MALEVVTHRRHDKAEKNDSEYVHMGRVMCFALYAAFIYVNRFV